MPPRKVSQTKIVREKNGKSEKVHTKFNDSLFKLHPYFKEIISSDPNDEYRYICQLCKANGARSSYYSGWREGLRGHLETSAHKGFTDKKMKPLLDECIAILGGSGFCLEEPDFEDQEKEELPLSKEKENEFYIKLAQFLIHNRLPFSATENILNFLKFAFKNYDGQLIERAHISNVTMTLLTKDCVAATLKEKLLRELKDTYFSILVDETSDLYGGNYIGLIVRYLEKGSESPKNKVLAVIELGTSGTGQNLYQKVKDELFSIYPELKQNLIGSCTDNARNMFSSQGAGFINRLQEDVPHLVHVRDLCHCYNLVGEAALEAFPKYILSFITNTCAHFSRSSQRRCQLTEIQLQEGCKQPLEVLSFKEIRWFSLAECTSRILELWKYLEIYFKQTDSILKESFTEEFLLLSQLLSCLLNKLAYFNKYFQKDTLLYIQVIDKIREGYTIFGQMLLKPSHENSSFDDIYHISFDKTGNNDSKNKIATDEEFKMGFLKRYSEFKERVESAKIAIRSGIEKEFFGIARDFVTKALNKMKEKLPFEQDVLNQSLVIYLEDREFNIDTWRSLGKTFLNVIRDKKILEFEEELERFKIQYLKIKDKYTSPRTSIITTWNLLYDDYPNMTLLARALIVLPYSSSSVESTFSRLKAFVTPYRNRLSVENVEASLLIGQSDESQSLETVHEMMLKFSKIWEEKPLSKEEVNSIEKVKVDKPEEHFEMRSKLPSYDNPEYAHNSLSNIEKFFTHLISKAITQQGQQGVQPLELLSEAEISDHELELSNYEYQTNSLKRKVKQSQDLPFSSEGTKRIKQER